MFCEKCGKQVKDGQKFCDGCGADLEAQRSAGTGTASVAAEMHVCCPKCGKQALDEDKFCTGCGASLEGVTPIPVVAPASAPNVEMHVYCPRCGMQALDDDKFCTGCGTTLEGVAPTPAPAAKKTAPNTAQNAAAGAGAAAAAPHVEKKPKKEKPPKEPKEPGFYQKHKVLFWLLMALLILLITAACVFFFVIQPRLINLSDYAEIQYKGRNTAATAQVEWNTYDLIDKLGNIEGTSIDEKDLEIILSNMTWTVTPNQKLKNGDTVNAVCEVKSNQLKRYKFIPYGKKLSTTVEGLGKYDTFDAFQDVKTKFSGISPDGTLDMDDTKLAEEKDLTVKADKTDGLKNGDAVTLTLQWDGKDLDDKALDAYGAKHKVVPEETTKQVEVSLSKERVEPGQEDNELFDYLYKEADAVMHRKGNGGGQDLWTDRSLMNSVEPVETGWDKNGNPVVIEKVYMNTPAGTTWTNNGGVYYTYVKFTGVYKENGSYGYNSGRAAGYGEAKINMFNTPYRYQETHKVAGWTSESSARSASGIVS